MLKGWLACSFNMQAAKLRKATKHAMLFFFLSSSCADLSLLPSAAWLLAWLPQPHRAALSRLRHAAASVTDGKEGGLAAEEEEEDSERAAWMAPAGLAGRSCGAAPASPADSCLPRRAMLASCSAFVACRCWSRVRRVLGLRAREKEAR